MDECKVDKLTEGQRACLQLVAQAMTSKEIAGRLGISSHTVDQRLRMAMKTLGATTRSEAARAFVAARPAKAPYQRLIYQSPPIASPPVSSPISETAGEWQREPAGAEHVAEAPATFDTAFSVIDHAAILPVPTAARRRNDLGPWQRLMWIVLIAILSAISFGALLNGMEGLARLLGWLS
jgi:DNA-binding CsgD family transcriptional regulator